MMDFMISALDFFVGGTFNFLRVLFWLLVAAALFIVGIATIAFAAGVILLVL